MKQCRVNSKTENLLSVSQLLDKGCHWNLLSNGGSLTAKVTKYIVLHHHGLWILDI
jgi:hypothetical protein